MKKYFLLQLLLGRVGELPGLLVFAFPWHLFASSHQRVEVDVGGRVHVELGRLAVLHVKNEDTFLYFLNLKM
jgi:hypothetical protein